MMKTPRLRPLVAVALAAVVASLLPFASAARADSPPLAVADASVTDEDTPVSIDVLANDSGTLDPSTLTVTQPLHGAVQVDPATATVRYTPTPHFSGSDSFRYSVCDTAAQCAIAGVDLTVVFFGRYRIVSSHPPYTATWDVGQLKLQQPDGTGLEDFPGDAAAYGLQSSISPAGEWLAFNTMSSIEIHSLTNPDDRVSFSLPRPSAPAWSPDGAYLVVESEGKLWRFVTPFPSTPVEPAFLADPKQFTYDVSDGAGGTATVPVLGYNPTWGMRGVAFENWWEYVDPTDGNRVSHIGIALVSFQTRPAQLIDGSLHQPDWSADDRLAVGCPGGLCILSPNSSGQYTSLSAVPGNLTAAQDPNDIQWSPDGSKIAFANRIVNADGSKLVYVNKVDSYTTNLSWDPRPFTPLAAPWTHAGRLAVQRIDHRSGGVHTVELSKSDTSEARAANALSDGVRPPRSSVWSPDGRRLALLEADPTSTKFELNVMDADGSNKHRLDGVVIGEIAWSPDGTDIAYLRSESGSAAGTGLFAIHPDGTGKRRITDYGPRYPTYSPDGRFIVFENSDQYGPITGLSYVRADGSAPPAPMQGLTRYPGSPAISRDGHLAFTNFYVYVADVNWDVTPVVTNVRQVTFVASGTPVHADTQPTWSPDSQAIAYSRRDSSENGPASNFHLYMVNADGSHDARIESSSVFEYMLPNWGAAEPVAATPAPLITAVDPPSGPAAGGTAVTITGTGFGGPGTTVTFGGVAAPVTGGSATSLQVTTPSHAAGAVDVVVTNPDAQAATKPAGFAYTEIPPPNRAPTITSIDPSTGPAAGGTPVTITGTFFGGPGTTVKFDGVLVAVTGGSSTSLQVTTPAHAAGAVDVVVTNPDNQFATSGGGFTYVNPPPPPPTPAPRISGISPATGATNGGTQVTITGTDFGGPGTRVTFGGVAATITGGSWTSIVVTTPAHKAGAVDVVVTNPDGQTSLRAKGFTYQRLVKCIRAFKKKICL